MFQLGLEPLFQLGKRDGRVEAPQNGASAGAVVIDIPPLHAGGFCRLPLLGRRKRHMAMAAT